MPSDTEAGELPQEQPDTPEWNELQKRYEVIQRCEKLAAMAEAADHHLRRERPEEGAEMLEGMETELEKALEAFSAYEEYVEADDD